MKDKNQLIEEEVVNNIIIFDLSKYCVWNSDAKWSKRYNRTKKKFAAFNKRDGEISQELITSARNDLFKSVIDAESEIPADVLNNITSSFELEEEDKTDRSVREHVQNTIKKTTNNI